MTYEGEGDSYLRLSLDSRDKRWTYVDVILSSFVSNPAWTREVRYVSSVRHPADRQVGALTAQLFGV
jgi:hypothetical protein